LSDVLFAYALHCCVTAGDAGRAVSSASPHALSGCERLRSGPIGSDARRPRRRRGI